MRKIWISPYQLVRQVDGGVRQGSLIKLQTDDFVEGFSDWFPWPEFGDCNFSDLVKELKSSNPSFKTKISLECAAIDGLAREQGVSLLHGVHLRNHFLCLNPLTVRTEELKKIWDQGYKTLKFKVGKNWEQEKIQLRDWTTEHPSEIRWRLDFNGQASAGVVGDLLEFSDRLEFVEDPYPDWKLWGEKDYWAYDQPGFSYDKVRARWQVIKPAQQQITDVCANNIVFTSSLDHPIGIAHAALMAHRYGPQIWDYGLSSHHVYTESVFSEHLLMLGAELSFIPEKGIGFTELLKNCEWQQVL